MTNVEKVLAFAQRFMTRDELRGFVRGISRSRGSEVLLPADYRTSRAAADYLCRALDEPTAARYLRVLEGRRRTGVPLVERTLVPKTHRPKLGPARNADEFERRQRQAASDKFWRLHEKNRQSPHYAKLRKKRLKVAGNRCEECGSQGRLQLHHLHYETLKAEKVTDVRILCQPCHAAATERQRAMRRARWRGGPSTRGPRLRG